MDIEQLISIAKDLNLQEQEHMLSLYKERLDQPNKDLVLPLVGEFSSGKTSLINAFLDNKNLETASRATTATIFEIKMGQENCYAEVINDGQLPQRVENVEELKNSTLTETALVRVYDTSTKVEKHTILVDTPGLSSNDPRHRIALSTYLPNADAVLLITDVNQQITRSLIDFVETSRIADLPVYLVVTKCDTKTPGEILAVKEYITKNIQLPLESIVCVSANNGDLSELYSLFRKIQEHKNEIVTSAINKRVNTIANEIKQFISSLLAQPDSTKEIDNAINEQERKLQRFNRNIESLIRDASSRIEDKEDEAKMRFKNSIFTQVDSIVKAEGRNCDKSLCSAVNSVGVLVLDKFKKDVITAIVSLARERQSKMDAVPLNVLETIDMSDQAFNGFSYNLDMNSIGHKHDKIIGIAALSVVTAGAAAIAAPVAVAGAASAGTAATGAGGGAIASTLIGESGEIIAGGMISKAVLKSKGYVKRVGSQMGKIEAADQALQQRAGMKKGVIETATGWVTDFFAKPQRQKAVSAYIDGTLIPELSNQLFNLRSSLERTIGSLLHQSAQVEVSNMEEALQEMKRELQESSASFKERKLKLNNYLKTING
jgi:Predicted GTPases